MVLSIETEFIPMQMDDDGVIRIGGSRVTLDTVVATFDAGATAEEIVQQYPSLNLADVYSVIGYYLHRRSEIEDYLQNRRQQADVIRKQNELQFDAKDIRERLLARKRI